MLCGYDVKLHGKQFIDNLDKESMKIACKKDSVDFGNSENVLDEGNETIPARAEQAYQEVYSGAKIEMLPYPISCMNKKEKVAWLTKEILREQRERTGRILKSVKYGDVSLKPSFWFSEEWDWLMTKNLSNVTKDLYTGPGEFIDFLSRSIVNCLAMSGIDPEQYVVANVDIKTI